MIFMRLLLQAMMTVIAIIDAVIRVDSVDLPPLVAQDGHSINISPIGHTCCNFTKTFNNIQRSYPCQRYTDEYLFLIREICEVFFTFQAKACLWSKKNLPLTEQNVDKEIQNKIDRFHKQDRSTKRRIHSGHFITWTYLVYGIFLFYSRFLCPHFTLKI